MAPTIARALPSDSGLLFLIFASIAVLSSTVLSIFLRSRSTHIRQYITKPGAGIELVPGFSYNSYLPRNRLITSVLSHLARHNLVNHPAHQSQHDKQNYDPDTVTYCTHCETSW